MGMMTRLGARLRARRARRSYDAGHGGRLNTNWDSWIESAESEDRRDRNLMRARARDLENNSDVINGVLSAYRRNIVGRGFTLQAGTDSDTLNVEIDKLWREWCRARNCDVTGMQSFTEILRMVVQRKKVDGGVLILKRYTNFGILPFQLQVLEVDELEEAANRPKHKGDRVVGGIEYNSFNRPVGFFISRYDVDGMHAVESQYIDAKDMIFWFRKRRPSQIREMTDLAPAMTRVRDVNEFITAVSVKERIAACVSVIIKRLLPAGGLGRNSTAAVQRRVNYAEKKLSPGTLLELNAGDDAAIVDPKSTADDANGFVKLLQRLIGSALGVSYEATSRDMSETNYSSARQGIIEDDLTYAEELDGLTAVMDEVYETFLISAVLGGALTIPRFWDNKREYMRHTWVGTPKPWIDPQKEANADKTALQTGQKTFKEIAAERGRDWRKQIDDMAEVVEYAKQKGIDIGGMLLGQGGLPEPVPGEDDDEP